MNGHSKIRNKGIANIFSIKKAPGKCQVQSLTNGGLSWNGKAILFRVDYIVASTLYKGAIIQENA